MVAVKGVRLRNSSVLVFSCVFLLSPVLHHDHGDPVRWIDMFTDEILKQQKRLHQEVLQEQTQDA